MERLERVVWEVFGERVDVRDLRRLTGGASRETWALTAGDRRLILRREAPSTGARGLALEAAALRAAADAGVPVPAVLAAADDPGVLGAPFVLMEHVEGETLAPRILRSDALADVRPRLAEQCGEILARIHAIDPAAVPELPAGDVLADLAATLRGFAEPSPALELGLRWLERHRPPATTTAVVHGDFRNGNLVVGPDGVRAVLDWELVHRGDPMRDLGWLCARAWRFGAPGEVGGFGAREDLFRGYERVDGRPVDPAVVRWWELFGAVWWGAGCMVQARRHLSGGERSLELAAIGWRVHEQEYDTLLLLEEVA